VTMRIASLGGLLLLNVFWVQAQTDSVPPAPAAKTGIVAKSSPVGVSRTQSEKDRTIMKPMLGLGFGALNYIGDVSHNEWTNPLVDNFGLNFGVIQNISPSFGLEFNFMYGRITANERDNETPRYFNFRTDIFQATIGCTYNFARVLPAVRKLNPYIGVGISAFNFTPKGDLKDANGYTYHYWSDGTIRNLPSESENASVIKRDHVYESDLRQADLDGLGKYSLFAFSIPFTAGLEFRVSNRSVMRLSTTFNLAFTDLMDNVSDAGEGLRKGNSTNDFFFYSNLSYHFDFFSPKAKKSSRYDDIKFPELGIDEDGDGVLNDKDVCPNSPGGVKVDEMGCPIDTDGDGFPDSLDEEPNTPTGLNVNNKGVGITDSNHEDRDTNATNRKVMYDLYTDHRETYKPKMSAPDRSDVDIYTGSNLTVQPLSGKMSKYDGDKNGKISVAEVYDAIDKFFDKEIDATVADINELIDFFFDQE